MFILLKCHLNIIIKTHGSVSRRVYHIYTVARSNRIYIHEPTIYEHRDYRISITDVELIKFWIDAIDSLSSNYIIKVFSFFSLRALWAEILRRKVRIWKFSFKKRRCHHCHRRPILCCTVATSDARGASDQIWQWHMHVDCVRGARYQRYCSILS